MTTRIQVRRDTAANWTTTNPVLTSGEPGLETDTGKWKLGNGSSAWAALAYQPDGATVAGKAPIANPTFTGTVSGVTKAMVGLGSVDNTADSAKPISSATQTALNAKAPTASPTFTGTVSGVTAAHVGLGNVDNTSDANKPVSTAQATQITAAKARANHTGTQSADTIVDGTTNKVYTATEKTKLSGLGGPVQWADIQNRPDIGDDPTTALFGWSGANIADVEQDIVGSWMARGQWSHLREGMWLPFNSEFTTYVTAHPDRAADIGVPLIPHDGAADAAGYNTMLDLAIANGVAYTDGNGVSYTTDQVYTGMGAALATMGPKTVYARVWWEFNMSPFNDGIDRAKFKAAWNRAIPLIRAGFAAAQPTKTLKIVFCSIADGSDYTAFYPDNDKVDIIAQDTYGDIWATTTPTASVLLADTAAHLEALRVFAASKGKPMALGEFGNWQTGTQGTAGSKGRGDFPEYIDLIFDWVDANNVLYVVYYNLPDNTGITLADTPLSLNRLKARVNGTPFLPEATVTTKGTVTLATQAEAVAGTEMLKAVTPIGVKAAIQAIDYGSGGTGVPPTTTKFGWTGAEIPGVQKNVAGIWMDRLTWANVSGAQFIKFNSSYMAYIAAYPTRSVDIGTALIPHDGTSPSGWNAMLDLASSNGVAYTNSAGTPVTTDTVYTNLGRNLAEVAPAQGTVYSRLWWEFNMRPQADSIDRAKFKAAWDRAVPLIRAGFAAKNTEMGKTATLKIVFCPISDGADYTAFWPTSANVDIVAQDTYAAIWGTTIPTSSALLAHVQGYIDALTTFAISKGKALALGEFGNWQNATVGNTTSHGRGDFPEYINLIFDWVDAQKNHPTSKVEYLVYFNNAGGGVGITLATQPNSVAAIQQRVNGAAYGGVLPQASDTRFGVVELATSAEALTGTDTIRAVTPAGLKAVADTKANNRTAINAQTGTTYKLVASDATTAAITLFNAGGITLTVPTNAEVPFEVGKTTIELIQTGAGLVTFAPSSGTPTIVSRGNAFKSTGQGAVFGLRKIGTDIWSLTGDLTV